MKDAVDRAPAELRLALIKAHPDLANKTQRAAGLTAESSAEQNSVGLDRLVGCRIRGVRARQQRLSLEIRLSLYRLRSPPHQGFDPARFRAAAAERCRDRNAEIDRGDLPDRGAAARPAGRRRTTGLPVHGRLSTHVLDTHGGKPAAGIAVELIELSDLGISRVVTRAVTNSDGRTDQPLIGGRPVPIGALRADLCASASILPRGRCRCRIRRSSTAFPCAFR